jgi:hypothetical protein
MLKLFSILHYWFYKYNFLSYASIFEEQFYFVVSSLKIIGYGKIDNNLESP